MRGRTDGIKKCAIIDEHKWYFDSCGLVVKVMNDGEGFEKMLCCGHSIGTSGMQSLKFGHMRTEDKVEEATLNTPHQGTA